MKNKVIRFRDIRPPKKWPGKVYLFAILGMGLVAFFAHPQIRTWPALQRAGLSLTGLLSLPLWAKVEPVWGEVQIGLSRLDAKQFFLLYYGGTAALLSLPVVVTYWLRNRIPPPDMLNAWRVESHRKKQGRLEGAERKRLLMGNGGGLPLASIAKSDWHKNKGMLGIAADELDAHTLILGNTGSGKGMQITEMMLSYPHAMFVIDPKGEQYERTAGHRSTIGPIYQIPGHTLDLANYYDLSSRDDVTELHYHLLKPWSSKQPIFANKIKAVFLLAGKYAKANGLNPIAVLIDAAMSPPTDVLNAFMTVDKEGVLAFTNGAKPNKLDKFIQSAWGTFQTEMFEYADHVETITSDHTGTSIPMDWAEQNATIYVTYPFSKLKAVGNIVSALIAGLIRKQIERNSKTPLIMAIDEMPTLGLGNIDEYLATVRSYGIHFVLYAQTYSQLEARYKPLGAQTILSNCNHQVWHPAAEERTAKVMSAMYGTELVRQTSIGRSRRKERFEIDVGTKTHSTNSTLRQEPALSPSETSALEKNEVVVRMHRRYVARAYRLWPVPILPTLPPPPIMTTRFGAARQVTRWVKPEAQPSPKGAAVTHAAAKPQNPKPKTAAKPKPKTQKRGGRDM